MNISWWFFKTNLRKRKREMRVTIAMVTMTVITLTAVLSVSDSTVPVMGNFVNFQGGRQDFVYSLRDYNQSFVDKLFPFQSTAAKLEQSIPEIDFTLGRLYVEPTYNRTQILVLGVDFSRELPLGVGLKDYTSPQDLGIDSGLNDSSCIISEQFARDHNLIIGDAITLNLDELAVQVFVTIVGTYNPDEKFPYGEFPVRTTHPYLVPPHVLLDLRAFGKAHPQYEGLTNYLSISLQNSENYYDFRDIDATERGLMDVAGRINEVLEPGKWDVYYYNLNEFQDADEISLLVTMVTAFTIVGTTFLSAILIYSSVSTAAAEKIREFGILRTVGGKKKHVFWQMMLHGVYVGGMSLLVGIPVALIIANFVLVPFVNIFLVSLWEVEATLVVRASTILIPVLIGLGVTLLVSIIPSLQAFRWSPVQSLNPERTVEQESMFFGTSRERRTRLSRMTIGIVLLAVSGYLLSVLPDFFLRLNVDLFVEIVIGLLFLLIGGTVLLALGINPLLLRGVLGIIRPVTRKLRDILKLGVFTHHRRNKIASLMLLLSFCLLVFALSLSQIAKSQAIRRLELVHGADLSLYTESSSNWTFSPEVAQDLQQMDGVESVSELVSGTSGFHKIYPENTNFTLKLSDPRGFQSLSPQFVGIDEYFEQSIYASAVNMKEGDFHEACSSLQQDQTLNVMISEDIAEKLYLHEGDLIKIEAARDGDENSQFAAIQGIFRALPGAFEKPDYFQRIQNPTIVMSKEHLLNLFGISPQIDSNLIMANLREGADLDEIELELRQYFGLDKPFVRVIFFENEVEGDTTLLEFIQLFIFITFLGIVGMAISGLTTATYSMFLERKLEFRIFRATGLSIKSLQSLIFLESLILLVFNGLLGTTIGIFIGYNIGLLGTLALGVSATSFPPLSYIAVLFGACIGILYLQIRRLFKKKIRGTIENSRIMGGTL